MMARIAKLHQVLAGVAPRVRLLDAACERALAADGDAAGGRCRGAGHHAGRHHENVVGAEGIAGGIALRQQDLRGETATAEELPLFGVVVDRDALIRHVHANEIVAFGARHGRLLWKVGGRGHRLSG